MIAPAHMGMNNERLADLIRIRATKMHEDQLGFWKFDFADRLVIVVTDESHNRMRIISPVAEVDSIIEQQWLTLMTANFDRALDARYCVNGQWLWSAFIHPLDELSSGQFVNALSQVVTLADNYGSSYSSGDLVFDG